MKRPHDPRIREFREQRGSPTMVIRGTAGQDQNTIHDNFENSRRRATHYLRKRGYGRSVRELRRNTLDSNCFCLTRLSLHTHSTTRTHTHTHTCHPIPVCVRTYRISFRLLHCFVSPPSWTNLYC